MLSNLRSAGSTTLSCNASICATVTAPVTSTVEAAVKVTSFKASTKSFALPDNVWSLVTVISPLVALLIAFNSAIVTVLAAEDIVTSPLRPVIPANASTKFAAVSLYEAVSARDASFNVIFPVVNLFKACKSSISIAVAPVTVTFPLYPVSANAVTKSSTLVPVFSTLNACALFDNEIFII